MRLSLILIFALVCLIAVSEAQKGKTKPKPKPTKGPTKGKGKCDIKCPKEGPAVCASKDKGKTTRKFGNNCLLTLENCKAKNVWKKLDLKKCK